MLQQMAVGERAMRTKWVLVGFGLLYALVALSFLPLRFAAPAIEGAWETFTGLVFAAIVLASIGFLTAVSWVTTPIARATAIVPAHAEEILLALICLGVAAYSAIGLTRKDLSPGRKGARTFFLLLALSIVAMVRVTLHSWAHFG